MIFAFLVIQTFVFKWDNKEKLFDAIATGVRYNKRISDTTKIFWISILTSWIAPCTVWVNNRSYNKDYSHLQFFSASSRIKILKKYLREVFSGRNKEWITIFCILNRKYYLLFISLTSLTSLIFWAFILNVTLRNFSLFDIQSFPPIYHCFHLQDNSTIQGQCYLMINGVITKNSTSCVYLCYSNICSSVVRTCMKNEHYYDVYDGKVFYILFGLLFLSLLASCLLQILGDYGAIFKFTSFVGLPIVHFSYIKDCLNAKLQHLARNSLYFQEKEKRPSDQTIEEFYRLALKKQSEWDERLTKLIEIGGKDVLKKTDPCTGETLMQIAYQKLCFIQLDQMMTKIKDNPINDLFKSIKIQDGVMYEARTSTWQKEIVEFKIIFSKEDTRTTIVFDIQLLINGRQIPNFYGGSEAIHISKLHNYICLIRETLNGFAYMRLDTKRMKEDINRWKLWQKLWFFYNKANFSNSEAILSKQDKKLNRVWRIPPLHMVVKCQRRTLLTFFVWILGVRMEGKDENQLTAYQLYLRNNKDFKGAQHKCFFWDLMQAGGDALTETKEEKNLTVKLATSTKLIKNKLVPTLTNTASYLAEIGDSESLQNVIEKGKFVHDSEQQTPLHVAILNNNIKCLHALLIKQPGYVNSINVESKTPLHIACEKQNLEAALLLLEFNADVNLAENAQMMTPLHLAAIWGNEKCLKKMITKKTNIDCMNITRNTALQFAIKYGNVQCVKLLIQSKAKLHQSLHFLATSTGKIEISKMLLDAELEIDNEIFLDSVKFGDVELIRIFLAHHADVNYKNESLETGLHFAARGGHFEVIKLLIENNANIAACTVRDKTPLHYVADPSFPFKIENLVRSCELLLEAGVDSSMRDYVGWTAAQCAKQRRLTELEKILPPSGPARYSLECYELNRLKNLEATKLKKLRPKK